jgi:hypothetical protein
MACGSKVLTNAIDAVGRIETDGVGRNRMGGGFTQGAEHEWCRERRRQSSIGVLLTPQTNVRIAQLIDAISS